MEIKNPYRLRTSEKIIDDDFFLRLFGIDALNSLPKDDLWRSIQPFRSSPGAGKTTLFRLFTPKTLSTLYQMRADEDIKPLFDALKEIDAISDKGPKVLGIYLSCAKNYANLEDINLQRPQKNRLFFALINARIIIASLRNALYLKGLDYPNDLEKLQITKCYDRDISPILPIPCDAGKLNDWASKIEVEVSAAIDSFSSEPIDSLSGHDTLYCLNILNPKGLLVDGQPIANHILLMLDDLHSLSPIQRKNLYGSLSEFRLPLGVWVGERLSALKPSEFFNPGDIIGRDYNRPINLEIFWREFKKFEKAMDNIANLRLKSAKDVQSATLASLLENSLDGMNWYEPYSTACNVISERVKKKAASSKLYDEWISTNEKLQGTPRENAIKWKKLEILIERDKIRGQQRLFEDLPIPEETLEKQESGAVKSAAEFFISKEFNIPYVYGFSNLSTLASNNIEQFLELTGDLFDEIIYSKRLKKTGYLEAKRQEAILKKSASKRWNEIPRRVSNNQDVINFLKAFHQMATDETFKPNAPYAPGITGIGISDEDFQKIVLSDTEKNNEKFQPLAKVIYVCISLNLLEDFTEINQGKINHTWKVLYLNRLLCLHFDLPLQKGGWKPKKIDELVEWIERGIPRPAKKRSGRR
ncbi:hypothetical protein [Methanoregula sp.]|jgi:hypothetical protein|uniref:ORC-CDC6 family AAA ATPase n=1 Tax=Methanoregula sp. TaxID=2052170 RepID=UPI003C2A924A